MELVDDDDVEVIRVAGASRPAALRLWIDAKTWSNVLGSLAADPQLAEAWSRSAWRNVARLCSRISSRCATNSSRARGSVARSRA